MTLSTSSERDWQSTLQQRAAEATRRRALRADARQAAARRRAHGMIDRHAARLARIRAGSPRQPPPGGCRDPSG